MKTPREVLLQRHQSAAPRLDAIRRKVVTDLTAPAHRQAEHSTAAGFFREFLLPLRWHLAGMSALWVLAALLSIDAPTAPAQSAKDNSSAPEVVAALFENRRQLAEMIDSPADEPAATPPAQPFVPRRRSALQPSFVAV